MKNKYLKTLYVPDEFIKKLESKLGIKLDVDMINHYDVQQIVPKLKELGYGCKSINDNDNFIEFEITDLKGNKTTHTSHSESILERCYDAIYLQLCLI